MSKVLILVGHPNLAGSRHNKALVEAVSDLEGVTVHDLYATYPDFKVDAAAEQKLLDEHDVIVFQHPVYWYNTTALFRVWQDTVLTYGWAFNYTGEPTHTTGKKAIVAATTGGPAEAYSAQGHNKLPLDEYLNNWTGTLGLTQFEQQESFVVHGALPETFSDEDLELAAKHYRELISSHL
jgi:glutathione-regulated potassium-efflux system ancillary protein KefG